MSAPLFEVRSLAAGREGAIGPVSFVLEAGDSATLSGPSGAGKSRLLRAMADLDQHAGECLLEGSKAQHFAPRLWRRRVGYLASESAWWGDLVGSHFPAGAGTAIAHGLAALDLPADALDRPTARLSSGQRQRLALLRLLAGQPAVVLLDEPTANLDSGNIARLEELIADYRRTRGAAVVWVGHDAAQRARVADRNIALDVYGRVAA